MADPLPTYYSPILSRPPVPSTTGAYEDALERTPSDYNDIQGAYKTLLDQIRSNPSQRLTANPLQYAQSGDETSALSSLQGLASNGGYSAQDIQDLRARGISPIRAVYANAERELARSRGLQGGYSPNFAAVSAKMARDQSQQIATQTSNVNAGIAEDVAKNKLAAAPAFASAAGSEESKKQNIDAQNEANRESTDRANVDIQQNDQNRQLSTIDAMRSLYGTTPALASTFGSQALGAAGINNENARATVAAGGTPYGQFPAGAKINPAFASGYGGSAARFARGY
jgi:hypothetical protein